MNATFRGPAATRALAVKDRRAEARAPACGPGSTGGRTRGESRARACDRRADGDRGVRGDDRGVRGRPPEPVLSDHAYGLLPALDGRPAGRLAAGSDAQPDGVEVHLHGSDRRDVRGLSARAEVRAAAEGALGDRRRAGGARLPVPGAAAGADRRVQLRQLRAHGGRAQPQPVHDDSDPRAARRPQLLPVELAPAAEPVRPAVHADDLRAGPARRGGLVLGDQGDPRRRQPRHDLSRVEVRADPRSRPDRGDRARRAEPDRARVGAGGRPQRLPDGLLHRARLLPAAARGGVGGGGPAGRGGPTGERAGHIGAPGDHHPRERADHIGPTRPPPRARRAHRRRRRRISAGGAEACSAGCGRSRHWRWARGWRW